MRETVNARPMTEDELRAATIMFSTAANFNSMRLSMWDNNNIRPQANEIFLGVRFLALAADAFKTVQQSANVPENIRLMEDVGKKFTDAMGVYLLQKEKDRVQS